MKNIILLTLYFTYMSIVSQETAVELNNQLNYSEGLNSTGSGAWSFSVANKSIKGSYYLFSNWINVANIISGDGQKYAIKNINYDTREQLFVTKTSLDSVFVFNIQTIKQVNVNNKVFRRYSFNNTYQYYELIASAKGKEILKKSIKIIKKGVKDLFTNSYKQDELILKTQYYFNSEDGLKEIKLKNKHFLKIFGNEALKIKKYISKNKLSLKKDSHIANIFKFYKKL